MSKFEEANQKIFDRWDALPKAQGRGDRIYADTSGGPMRRQPDRLDTFMDTTDMAKDAGVHLAIVNARFAAEIEKRARWIEKLQQDLSTAESEVRNLKRIVEMAGEVIQSCDHQMKAREVAITELARKLDEMTNLANDRFKTIEGLTDSLKAKRKRSPRK